LVWIFLLDEKQNVYLLEVNAGPDFGQTGLRLQRVCRGVIEGAFVLAIDPYFSSPASCPASVRVGEEEVGSDHGKFRLCYNQLSRTPSSKPQISFS